MQKKPNPPLRHHYVPQFYSRGWVGDDGLLEFYRKPLPSKLDARRISPKSAGQEAGLYTINSDSSKDRENLEETFFRVIDNNAASAHQKLLVRDSKISIFEANSWTNFILSMLLRTPDALHLAREQSIALLDELENLCKEDYNETRTPNLPLSYEEYIESLTDEVKAADFMRYLPRLIANQEIGDFIIRGVWRAFELPEGAHDLLLSDDPMIRSDGNGFGVHLAMPLSPRIFLIMVPDMEIIQKFSRLDDIPGIARQINISTVESARRFVIARDRSQSRFIENRFGRSPKPPFLPYDRETALENARARLHKPD